MTFIRDYFRRRRVAKYEAKHGNDYVFSGVKLRLPKSTSVAIKSALLRGKYEREELGFISKYLPADKPVVELGGSIGGLSSFVRSRLNENAKQVVVEANPELAKLCFANVALQPGSKNTSIISAAIDYTGKPFVCFDLGDNEHVGRVNSQGSETKFIEVPVTTLEKLVSENLPEVQEFTLICDIEGAELDLVSNSTVLRNLCTLLIIETHPNFYTDGQTRCDQLIQEILSLGFTELEHSNTVFVFAKH